MTVIIAMLLYILNPWQRGQLYTVDIVVNELKKVRVAIEEISSVRMTWSLHVSHKAVKVKILLPYEKPLTLPINYSILIFPLITSSPSQNLTYGLPPKVPYSNERSVSLYVMGSMVIIEPKLIISLQNHTIAGGVNEYVLLISYIKIKPPVEKGLVLHFVNTSLMTYTRTYLVKGTAEVLVNGQRALTIDLKPPAILWVIVREELWACE